MGLRDKLQALLGRQGTHEPAEQNPNEFHIQLNDKAMPVQRGAVYEDPLDAFLAQNGLGQVVNSGSMLSEVGEIEFSDIDVELTREDVDRGELLSSLITLLEAQGAPKGSFVVDCQSDVQTPIGKLEGMGVYLNGTDLPPEVYEQNDVNDVIEQMLQLLGLGDRDLRFWEGATETALYFYGDSYEDMSAKVAEFAAASPLCERCRIIQIA
jgi:hypothetical protein